MKITLAIVLCLAALAYGRPSGRGGKGEGKSPLVGKVLGFCLRLLEEAVDDPEKRSWDDVFGALAPVCEDLLKMGGPRGGDGSGSGSGDRPEKPEDGSGSGDEMEKRMRGDGSGSGDRPGRPEKEDGSGSGSGDDEEGEKLFWGLYKVCGNLKELFEASQDKRSWEDIFMSLYEVCEAAKEKVEAEKDADDDEADLERRPPARKPAKGGSGSGSGDWWGESGSGESGSGEPWEKRRGGESESGARSEGNKENWPRPTGEPEKRSGGPKGGMSQGGRGGEGKGGSGSGSGDWWGESGSGESGSGEPWEKRRGGGSGSGSGDWWGESGSGESGSGEPWEKRRGCESESGARSEGNKENGARPTGEPEKRSGGPKGGMSQGGRGGDKGGRGDEGKKPDEASGSGSGDEVSDEQYRLGYKTVMSLIKLCEGMAALGDQEPPEDADPEWVAIFTSVGEVCVATHEQIVADMGEQMGEEGKRMMRGGKGGQGGRGGKGKGTGGDDGERGSGDDGERGSGDRKPDMPENPVEALLDICESLLELEKEVLERRQSKVSVDVVAGLMRSVCESAFNQAEEDEKKKR